MQRLQWRIRRGENFHQQTQAIASLHSNTGDRLSGLTTVQNTITVTVPIERIRPGRGSGHGVSRPESEIHGAGGASSKTVVIEQAVARIHNSLAIRLQYRQPHIPKQDVTPHRATGRHRQGHGVVIGGADCKAGTAGARIFADGLVAIGGLHQQAGALAHIR